ncbi:eukaryotic translation initiation factor 3 subunit g-like protein, partial [Trifolium pratense]
GTPKPGFPPLVVDEHFLSIPGVFVPGFLWPFVKEMIAKSGDKTVVATNLPRRITDDSQFPELFKPFGEVVSANLAAVDPECSRHRGFGFVKFVNMEDAQQAIHKLNDSGPYGCTVRVGWVPRPKKNQQPKRGPEVTSSRGRS